MVRFFKYQDGDEMVVINPAFVAHIQNNIHGKESIITMSDGRRYLIPTVDSIGLSEEFEKLANYGGI